MPGIAPGEKGLDITPHLRGQPRARFVHAERDSQEPQPGIHMVGHEFDRLEQFAQAMQGEKVGLQRQEHLVDRSHRVEREQPERRRTVDDHIVEGICDVASRAAWVGLDPCFEDRFAAGPGRERDFGRREIDVRRHDHEVFTGRHTRGSQRFGAREHVVRRHRMRPRHHAHVQRCVGLRVEVHEAHAPAGPREGHGEIHRRRRLADAALAVCHGDRTHACPHFGPGLPGGGEE